MSDTGMSSDGETPQEMLDRLSLIALGERECDLSDNDTMALEWLLTSRAEMVRLLDAQSAAIESFLRERELFNDVVRKCMGLVGRQSVDA